MVFVRMGTIACVIKDGMVDCVIKVRMTLIVSILLTSVTYKILYLFLRAAFMLRVRWCSKHSRKMLSRDQIYKLTSVKSVIPKKKN